MTRGWPALVMAMLAGLLAAPAAASKKSEARDLATMHKFAACVVKAHRATASEAIIANSDNTTIMKRFPQLIDGDCLGNVAGNVEMKFKGDLFRYALADALVNEADFAIVPASFENRLPLAHLLPPDPAQFEAELAKTSGKRRREELKAAHDTQIVTVWLSRYGECIARRDPANARLWLLTPPGGPEETSRVNALRPAFNNCLGEGTLRFGRLALRGAVAINYYRLAMATPVAGRLR